MAFDQKPGSDIAYVGHEKCAECHAEIAEIHLASPHAHTFAYTKDSSIAQQLCGKSLLASSPYDGYNYTCDELGVMAAMPEKFGETFPLDFALGSGKHAMTFLTLMQDGTGTTVGIEHRKTWFTGKKEFGLTPGHEDLVPNIPGEYFGRIFVGEDLDRCVDCHTTTAEIVGRELKNVYASVQCEECHGPGSAHVAAAEAGKDNLHTYLESRWSAEQEVMMCGRCHRLPKDIETERLKRYPKSVVRFQSVGLLQSPCYLESKNLSCTTCHSPHDSVESRTMEQQIQSCIECHEPEHEQHVSCPVSPQKDCIRCHMPAIELLDGISFHDHWIRVRDDIE